MIPGWIDCPQMWVKEYHGYLMTTPGQLIFLIIDSDQNILNWLLKGYEVLYIVRILQCVSCDMLELSCFNFNCLKYYLSLFSWAIIYFIVMLQLFQSLYVVCTDMYNLISIYYYIHTYSTAWLSPRKKIDTYFSHHQN